MSRVLKVLNYNVLMYCMLFNTFRFVSCHPYVQNVRHSDKSIHGTQGIFIFSVYITFHLTTYDNFAHIKIDLVNFSKHSKI